MIILLRGDICRGCTLKIQLLAYKSIISHVIKPLNKNCNDINIIITTYDNNYKKELSEIFKDYNFFYFIISRKNQVVNFINSINIIPDFLINGKNNLLILRSDLYFKQDINYSRISKDKILTQWNLFHQKSTGEFADQIQFIGSSLIKDFIIKINNNKIDTRWRGSLHNFYNFCVRHFGIEKISYLNYIENPNPNKDKCIIRGNPKNGIGNPLYNYTRYEK